MDSRDGTVITTQKTISLDYFFTSLDCELKFDKSPQKYLQQHPVHKKIECIEKKIQYNEKNGIY